MMRRHVTLGVALALLSCTDRPPAPQSPPDGGPLEAGTNEVGAPPEAGRETQPVLDAAAERAEVQPQPGDGDPTKLMPAELARRLARAIWRLPPDQPLLTRLSSNPPRTRDELKVVAHEMLAEDRGRAGVRAFILQWLGLERVPEARKDEPGFALGLWPLLVEETARFAEYAVYEQSGSLDHLLWRSHHSLLNERLAKHYGIPGILGDAFRRVEFEPEVRGGVITQGAFLAAATTTERTSPSHRGQQIIERILCSSVIAEPAGFRVGAPAPSPPLRRWIETATAGGECNGCHKSLDPYGFPLEVFDQYGRYRREDGGLPIDPVVQSPGSTRILKSPVDLGFDLAQRPEVLECFVMRWFSHATGRELPWRDASLLQAVKVLTADDGGIRNMLAHTVTSEAFLTP